MKEKPGAAELEIIKVLKSGQGGFISGQGLSRALGISRTAIWKHIKNLKEMGFRIEASPSKGYRLDISDLPFNDIEILSGLSTGLIARNIHFFSSLDSTNIKAYELGRLGAPEGSAVIAETQTRGKGRIGRRWESPPGLNLYVSIILRPPVPPQSAHNLTFLSAVALAESIEAFISRKPEVKWPNDILIDGKKTAGILLEMDSEPDRVHFVIAGIGVNLNMKHSMLPEVIRPIATSVSEKAGREIDRAQFARSLFSSMEKWYKVYLNGGFGPILDAWKGFFTMEGKALKVTSFDKVTTGVCAGVDPDGALLLKTASGDVMRVISGDVESVR